MGPRTMMPSLSSRIVLTLRYSTHRYLVLGGKVAATNFAHAIVLHTHNSNRRQTMGVCSTVPYRLELDFIMPKIVAKIITEPTAEHTNTRSTTYELILKSSFSSAITPRAKENPDRYSKGSIIFVNTMQDRQ